jgi:hypothetical protein
MSLDEMASTVDGTLIMAWTLYGLGVLRYASGRIMIATFDTRGRLDWFLLLHDDTWDEYGDIPFDHELGWYVEYPRRY